MGTIAPFETFTALPLVTAELARIVGEGCEPS
jgi:hypothetical protein